MTIVKWLATAAGIYGGLLALMFFAQRSLMYFPDTARTAPAAAGLPQAEEVVLDTADKEKVIIWHVPAAAGRMVVVYFHGNGGSLRYRVGRFRALTADGIGLVALSYRGYGGSSGAPSEDGLLRDGAAAYDFATARYGAERIVLWGESLGTGVAVALAAERPVARVVLESPFTSAADVGASAYPFIPVRLLIKDPFPSDQRIGRVTAPVLMLQGGRDTIIPNRFGERLYALIRAPKRLVRFPEGGHNDLDSHGAIEAVKAFLASQK